METTILTIPMGFDQCYLLKGEGCVLVDAGAPRKIAELKKTLEKAGISPSEIGLVVITHGHWDHIGSAKAIKELTGAPIAMHRQDAPWLERGEKPLSAGITPWGRLVIWLNNWFKPFIKVPPVKVDIHLGDEGMDLGEYGIPGRVIHTPGHTYGSLSVLLETGEAFVGDLVMNRLPLRVRPGLGIFGDDARLMEESLARLLERGATVFYPSHGRPFEAGQLKL